jgi:hypothetical protein
MIGVYLDPVRAVKIIDLDISIPLMLVSAPILAGRSILGRGER